MDNVDVAMKFAEMYRKSRYDSGKSQKQVADAMGVSVRTIQNWEDGTSSPTQVQSYQWFNAICVPPQKYLFEIYYPDIDGNKLHDKTSDPEVDKALAHLLSDLPGHIKRKLLFILLGEHGSSPAAVIDMIVAYLLTPLKDRLNICLSIINNYEIAEALDMIIFDNIKPSVNKLKDALTAAIKAVTKRK